jgi:hypothetical protein
MTGKQQAAELRKMADAAHREGRVTHADTLRAIAAMLDKSGAKP